MRKFIPLVFFTAMVVMSCSHVEKADLILMNGEVNTMEKDQPWSSAVAIKDNKIVAVPDNDRAARRYAGPDTRMVDLAGKFVLPGFIDGHTHFDGTGAQLNDANLLAVSDEEGLRKEIARVVDILKDGEWITRGLWGAYEQWALGASEAGANMAKRWMPDRRITTGITGDIPVTIPISGQGTWGRCIPLSRQGMMQVLFPMYMPSARKVSL